MNDRIQTQNDESQRLRNHSLMTNRRARTHKKKTPSLLANQ